MQEKNPVFTRRAYERFKVNVHAFLVFDQKTKKGLQLKNISVGGLCGLIDYPLRADEQAEAVLYQPFFDEFVKRNSRVAWCTRTNSGIWEFGLDFGYNKIDLSKYSKPSSS